LLFLINHWLKRKSDINLRVLPEPFFARAGPAGVFNDRSSACS